MTSPSDDLSKLGDAELSILQQRVDREKADRETRRKKAALAKFEMAIAEFQKLPEETIKLLLSLFEHGRTSCSDDNVCNGWWSNEDDTPRCNKCALIETLKGTFPPDLIVSFTLELHTKSP